MSDELGFDEERFALNWLISAVDKMSPGRRVTGFIDTGYIDAPVAVLGVSIFFDIGNGRRKSYDVPAVDLVCALRRHLGVERLA